MARLRVIAVGLIALLVAAPLLCLAWKALRPAGDAGPAWFQDVTEEVGLDFVHDCGPTDGRYFLPQHLGSGAALFDFDGDGLLDVYLLNAGGPDGRPNKLYKQLPDGKFADVSAGSGLDFSGLCVGVAVGDVNNDGLPDVLVTEYGRVRLFLNLGGGKFRDVTQEAGIRNPSWGVSAAFVDYDRDGWLDLVIVNYLDYDPTKSCTRPGGGADFCGPTGFPGTPTRLFRNVSSKGSVRFEDVSFESGIGRTPGPGFVALCADFDGDGWPDVLVTNDARPNHLWINQHNGTFREEAAARGVAVNRMGRAEGNMGIGWADVDGDGLPDLFVTHLNIETNVLWKQGPRGLFEDRTAESRLHHPAWRGTGFGTALADFDNDGAPDAVVVNGKVYRDGTTQAGRGLPVFWHDYAQRSQVFRNDGKGVFTDVSGHNGGPRGFCGEPMVGRGLAVGDVRNDGRLWVLVTGVGGPARLFENVAPDRGNWLVIRAYDGERKRDALGAELTVLAGGRKWVRTVHAAGSFACSSDPRAHVGLGRVAEVDAIEVVWPDGRKERFRGGPVNRHVVLTKGEGDR
jgi:hypothetical protein